MHCFWDFNIRTYWALENCLFGVVSMTPHPSGGTDGNVIIFGVDMSSSTKIDDKKKDILILGKGPTQGL